MAIRDLDSIQLTGGQRAVLDTVAEHLLSEAEAPTVDAILLRYDHAQKVPLLETIDDLVSGELLEKGGARGEPTLHLTPTGILLTKYGGEAAFLGESLLNYVKQQLAAKGVKFKGFSWEDLRTAGVVTLDEEYPLLRAVIDVLGLSGNASLPRGQPGGAKWGVPYDIVDIRALSDIRDLRDRAESRRAGRRRTPSSQDTSGTSSASLTNAEARFSPAQPHIDLALVVATDKEHDAVLHAAEALSGRPQPVDLIHGDRRSYEYLGQIGSAHVALVRTEPGTATVGGSLSTIEAAISEIAPRTIIMVGISFGLDPSKQPIGQVFVSKQIQQYEVQRVGTDKNGGIHIVPRGDRATATPVVLSRLRASKSTQKLPFEIDFGLVLSGEKLIDNIDYRDQLRALEPEALGGEMEAGGLYVAAVEHQVAWCVVKAVCDYADGNKSDEKDARQALAARNAATFVLGAIGCGGFGRASVGSTTGADGVVIAPGTDARGPR